MARPANNSVSAKSAPPPPPAAVPKAVVAPSVPEAPNPPAVLIAEPSLGYRSVLREALTAFRLCQVDETPSGERAFELALQRTYQLFIFSFAPEDMSGMLLNRLLAKAYPLTHSGVRTAPPVIFIMRTEDTPVFQELQRDARVRGALTYPPKLDVLLSLTNGILPERTTLPAYVP